MARLSGLGNAIVRDAYALLAALGIELVAALSFPAAARLSMRVPLKATEKAQDGQELNVASNVAATTDATPEAVSESKRPVGDLAIFAEACLNNSPGAWTNLRDVHNAYVAWCEKTSQQPLPDMAFRRVFTQLCDVIGYEVARRGASVRLGGVELKRLAA